MSPPTFAQVPAAPPVTPGAPEQRPMFCTHFPVVVLQTSLFEHCVSVVHLPQTFGPPDPQMLPALFVAQSVLVQQFPGTHVCPQQKSVALAEQAVALVVHAAETHVPAAVLQIVLAP